MKREREAELSTELVTPEMAAKWLETCTYEYQRKLRSWHVEELVEAIKARELEPDTVLRFHAVNGHEFMTDGQHRCWAVIESGEPFPFVVLRRRVDSMEDVHAAYRHTDCGTRRSLGELIATADLPGKTGLIPSQVSAISGAVPVIACGFRRIHSMARLGSERSSDTRIRSVEYWAQYGQAYFRAIDGTSRMLSPRLRSAAVLALGMVTFHEQQGRAQEFWRTVAENDGLLRGTPHHTLVEFLVGTGLRSMGHHEYARRVACAWNSAFEGKEKLSVLRLYPETMENPIQIKGTRYNGRDLIVWHPDTGFTVRK